jgi:hypothetical protein
VTAPRTLPIRIPPLPGEGLDSWLETQAHELHSSLGSLFSALGLAADRESDRWWSQRDCTIRLTAEQAEDVATATGLTPGDVAGMTLARYDGRAVKFSPGTGNVCASQLWSRAAGSRYCPDCLAETRGRWKLSWRLGWSYACPVHRRLLADTCPDCGRVPRQTPYPKYMVPAPGLCVTPVSKGKTQARCGRDLSTVTTRTLDAGHPALRDQQFVLDAIDSGTCDFGIYQDLPQPVARMLTDVRTLGQRVLRYEPSGEFLAALPGDIVAGHRQAQDASVPYLYRERLVRLGTEAPVYSATTAFAVMAALRFLRQPGIRQAGEHLRNDVIDLSRDKPTVVRTWGSEISPNLRAAQLTALAPTMAPVKQLRYRTASPLPCDPDPSGSVSLRRARSTPSLLWQSWSMRLTPPGTRMLQGARAALAAMLLHVGSRAASDTAGGHLGGLVRTYDITFKFIGFRDEPAWPAMQEALIRLAGYLDARPAPIDYARRRSLDYTGLMTAQAWAAISGDLRLHPGREARLEALHCLLFERLSGLLAERAPAFTRDGKSFRRHLNGLPAQITTDLAAALDDHARQFLDRHGITGEPLTWEPPLELLAGLDLPGPDPSAIDAANARRLAFSGGDPSRPRAAYAAEQLHTTVEVVRYVLEQHPQPAAPAAAWPGSTRLPAASPGPPRAPRPVARERLLRLEQRLPRETLAALYENLSVKAIAGQYGVPLRHVRALRDLYGIPARPFGSWTWSSTVVDPEWLYDQYVNQQRTFKDLGSELGVNPDVVARLARRHQIPLRGFASTPPPSRRPSILDPALDRWYGEQRLSRFASLVGYPSLRAAGEALGFGCSHLVGQIQLLERDLGGKLIIRGRPHRPMQLIPLGEQVIAAIDKLNGR